MFCEILSVVLEKKKHFTHADYFFIENKNTCCIIGANLAKTNWGKVFVVLHLFCEAAHHTHLNLNGILFVNKSCDFSEILQKENGLRGLSFKNIFYVNIALRQNIP